MTAIDFCRQSVNQPLAYYVGKHTPLFTSPPSMWYIENSSKLDLIQEMELIEMSSLYISLTYHIDDYYSRHVLAQ